MGVRGVFTLIVGTLFLRSIVARAWAAQTHGRLEYGAWVASIGALSLFWVAFAAWALAFDEVVSEQPSEFWSAIGLIVGFGASATYCFGEYFGVRGTYDEAGICIKSPWTGRKSAAWGNLKSVDFNRRIGGYTLVFEDDMKIRLSLGLRGVSGLAATLNRLGFDVELPS